MIDLQHHPSRDQGRVPRAPRHAGPVQPLHPVTGLP
jgi:hypothetical protein